MIMVDDITNTIRFQTANARSEMTITNADGNVISGLGKTHTWFGNPSNINKYSSPSNYSSWCGALVDTTTNDNQYLSRVIYICTSSSLLFSRSVSGFEGWLGTSKPFSFSLSIVDPPIPLSMTYFKYKFKAGCLSIFNK